MRGRRIWAIGGFVAGAVLILFGAAALYLGVTSYQLVRDELSQEKIVGGEDMSPEAIAAGASEAGLEDVDLPDCDVVDEEIDTGEEARCFSEYMRVHALEATGGLTYAQMGRFPVCRQPRRRGRYERRGRGCQGRGGQPGLERPAEHLDQRDRARDRAQRLVYGRATLGVRDRRRDRARPHWDRADPACLRRVRTRAKRGAAGGIGPAHPARPSPVSRASSDAPKSRSATVST